ncbi:MAG TPA: hypothetical protein VF423_08115 [Actinomycetes bacterium]
MTPDLPAMATLSEIVGTAVRAATHRVSEGSRRNARAALEARYQIVRDSREVLAAFPAQGPSRTSLEGPASHRRSA